MDIYKPTFPSKEAVAEEKNSTETKPASELSAPADLESQLQADLAKSQADAEAWHDRFLRKAAEFENYRKRTEKEKIEFTHLAKSTVLLEFLPVMDAYDRALESFNGAKVAHEGLDQYKEGIQLLFKQMRDVLNRLGVVAIEAEGNAFDPHIHEALTHEETGDFAENTVIKVMQRGYLYKDRLLRPAQVRVATRPKGGASSSKP